MSCVVERRRCEQKRQWWVWIGSVVIVFVFASVLGLGLVFGDGGLDVVLELCGLVDCYEWSWIREVG